MKLSTTAAAWTVTGALGLAVVAGTVAAFVETPAPEPRPAVTVAGAPAPEPTPTASAPGTDDRDDDGDRDDDRDDSVQGQADPTKPRPLASPVSPKSPVSAPSGD